MHAGVSCEAHQRDLRERLGRYVARPAVAEKRLTASAQGKVVYLLKTPYRDGTTHVVFEPLDFIARLAALVPRPRANLTRYHDVLAPNHRWRAAVTPAGRGRGKRVAAQPEKSTIERHVAMSWAQRLKRVFAGAVCGYRTPAEALRQGPVALVSVWEGLYSPYASSTGAGGCTCSWRGSGFCSRQASSRQANTSRLAARR